MRAPNDNLSTEWQMAKSNLTERNKHMFNNPLISDVKFLIPCSRSGGEMRTIPAHKYILAITSPVFFTMFHGAMPETGDPIPIPDCDYESFLELCRFIYCDQVKLTESNVCLVLYLAKKYLIPSLSEMCVRFMGESLSAKTVFAILPGVHLSDDDILLEQCWKIVDRQTTEAINSEAFLNVSNALLCRTLERDNLTASEVDIFHAVDKWCEKQCAKMAREANEEEKRDILGDGIYLIRFPILARTEVASVISRSGLLSRNDATDLYRYFNNIPAESPLKFSQLPRQALSSFEDSWRLVFHNDTDGRTLAGSRASLVAAVSSGARIRVFIEALVDGGVTSARLYSTEADNLSIYGGHVFAQLLQNVSKASWESFHDDVYWWWLITSTDGSVHALSCYVGANTLRANGELRARVKWFVKPSTSAPVYSNDKSGQPLTGSLEDLRAQVRNGCAVSGLNNKVFAFPAQTLTVEKTAGYVAAQNVDHVGQTMFPERLKFPHNPYWCFSIVTTSGVRNLSRWTVGLHQSRGKTTDEVATDWFVDSCWELAYAHDESGTRIAGSRDALVKAVLAGQRVRFQIVERDFLTIEADNLTVRDGHVTAEALKNLSKVTLAKFADDVSWSWLLVSTSGSARVIQYDVGSSNYRGNLVGNFAINWFVDTRFWHPVLSHDADGAVLAGSREQLVRAVKEGAAVRCVQDGAATDFCFQAQNLEISPDEQHVAAQTLNQVGTQDGLGLSDSKSCSNAHWSFTIISSNGKREVSRWTVGKHEKRGRSSDRVATKWFVNH